MNAGGRIAIIGGGWAGLVAGVELSAAGFHVTLFEAARQLGGRARKVSVIGHSLDNGQHILVGAYRETLRLMRKVGASPEQLLRRLPLQLSFPESQTSGFNLRLPPLPAPLHLLFGILGARGVGLGEKIAAARFMRKLQRLNYRLAEDCSVATLLDQHGQHGTLRNKLWNSLCLAALNTTPENASAQIFANTLKDSLGGDRAATDLLLPAADLGELLPAPAAAFILAHGGHIRFSERVKLIEEGASGFTINGAAFDHVILATAPQHAASLLADDPRTADTARMLDDYCYEPIGTVYLGYPATVALPFPMLGIDGSDGRRLGQWVFDRGALEGTRGLMAFVLSGNGHWDALDNRELAETLHGELQQILGKALPRPHWSQVIRERKATFSCRPNLPRPALRTARPGLWLAGDYVCADYPATLEGAVRSGVAVAHAILTTPGKT